MVHPGAGAAVDHATCTHSALVAQVPPVGIIAYPSLPGYNAYAGPISPNSGGTLDERGGCTTGCALNVIAEEEAYLVETAAEIRAEEATRAVTEAQVLNNSLAALSAAEEVRALREEGELQIALDAERRFEDERADAEAKNARQHAAREKKRLEEVQLALTQARR